MIDRFERFSAAISEISRYWHKIASDEMERYGLKGPHAVYFTTMYHRPEGITSAKLAELCSRDKSDVSRTVSILEEKGLLVKEGGNSYRALLKLTQQGIEVARKVNEKAMTAVEIGGKGLTDEDREVFYRALDMITANLQVLSREGLDRE